MSGLIDIAEALGGVPSGDGWKCRCPAHDDKNPSLSVSQKDGKILVKCHAGCANADVIAALTARGLWATKSGNPSAPRLPATAVGIPTTTPTTTATKPKQKPGKIVATYDYLDETGTLLFQVVRFEPKDFRQRKPDGSGGWNWKLGDTRRVLYRLPEIMAAEAVVIVEGEKDVHALESLGIPATCNPGGAGKWLDGYTESLAGKRIAIIGDADDPGRAHVALVAGKLQGHCPSIRVLECPDPWHDIAGWIGSGATREQVVARIRETPEYTVPVDKTPGNSATVAPTSVTPPPGDGPPPGQELPPAYSEEALALEFAERYAGQHLYVHAWARWLRWDGSCWIHDELGTGIYAVRELCRERSAALASFLESQAAPVSPAKKIAAWSTVSSVERLSRYDPRLAESASAFDGDPWLLNTPAGMVDLHTGNIRPHDPLARCSKITPAGPAGDAPTWAAFLNRSTNGDTELIAFLQRWAGYCLTGDISAHALTFIHGPAAAGKSRFAEALRYMAGSYGQTAPQELLIASKHERHATELARLQGARLVVAAETQENRSWDEARVKQLTGGDTITARFMRADFFEFQPTMKLLIHGNHQPRLQNPDDAMRRRLLVVPFIYTVPEEERDPDLARKLEAEAGGILAWAIEGCMEFMVDGLRPSRAVIDASQKYFETEDIVGRFLTERCVVGDAFESTSAAIWEAWQKYADDNGERPGTPRRLLSQLSKKGITQRRTAKQRFYSGVGLQTSAESQSWQDSAEMTVD